MAKAEAVAEFVRCHFHQVGASSPEYTRVVLIDDIVFCFVEVDVAAGTGKAGVRQGAAASVKWAPVTVGSRLESMKQTRPGQYGSESSPLFHLDQLGQIIGQVLQ